MSEQPQMPMSNGDTASSLNRWCRRWAQIRRLGLALGALAWAMAAMMPHADVQLYAHYASLALRAPVLHLLPKEYPGTSIGLFLLPRLLPMPYVLSFSIFAELALFALLISSDGLPGRPGWSRRLVIYLALGTLAVLVARYDILPALAMLLAVERARSERWGRAWSWAVFGALLKLFPILLLPGFLLAERRRTGRWAIRRIVAATAVFAATAAAQIIHASGSLSSPFAYEFHRGFELESLPSTLTLLASPLHVYWLNAFGAIETAGPLHGAIGAFLDLLVVVALAAIWRLASKGRLSIEATSLAVVTVAVLGDKAFSAQYLIWLVPLWAYWEIRRGWLVVAGLTTIVFPFMFFEAYVLGPAYYLPTAVAGLRNVVLLVSTLSWLREQLASSPQKTAREPMDLTALPSDPATPTGVRAERVPASASARFASIVRRVRATERHRLTAS